jgi:glycosyltransferase involved in cell wall biosynthesis
MRVGMLSQYYLRDGLVDAARRRGLRNVTFRGRSRELRCQLFRLGRYRGRHTEERYPGGGTVEAVQAMASGLPVVLVATCEPAKILASAKAGFTVKPGDIDGLAAALGRLSRSKEKRASLGAAGRVAAVERFDRRPLCDQFIEVRGGA